MEETPSQKVEEEEDFEKFDESKYTYLGMGLWEKKDAEPKPEPEKDPFCDLILSREFPFFSTSGYKLLFKKQKSKFLNPGEKVERFCPPEKLSRIIIVDEHFKILEDFGLMHTFEDDFYLNALCPQGQEEYYKKYSDVGILPLFGHRSLCWRIKISQE